MKYAGMPFGMCVLMKELGLYDLIFLAILLGVWFLLR